MQSLLQHSVTGIWILLELLCQCVFAGIYLRPRWGKRRMALAFAGMYLLRFAAGCLRLPPVAGMGVTLGLSVIWLCCAFQGAWRRRISVIAGALCLLWGIDAVVHICFSLLLRLPFRDPVWQNGIRYPVTTAARMIGLSVAYLIRRGRMVDFSRFVAGHGLFLTLLFPGISLLLIVLSFDLYHEGAQVAVLLPSGILAAANMTVLYLLHAGQRESRDDTEVTLLHKQMELQTQSILSLERSYREQRKAAHEFRHHMQTLRDLLEQGQTDTAREYVVHLQNTSSTRVLCVNSRHPIVDAILNQKYQAAAERNVDMQIQVNDLSGTVVDTEALVVVLTNLLDNAIEACERLQGGRQIRCSVLLQENLFLSVGNTALPVKIENHSIPTSKMPREDHGYGLPGVCGILDRLEAEYTFAYADGWFHFVAEIPIAQGASNREV